MITHISYFHYLHFRTHENCFDVGVFRWWIIFFQFKKKYLQNTTTFQWKIILFWLKAKIYLFFNFLVQTFHKYLFLVIKVEKILFTLQINRKKVWPINYSVSKKTRNEGRVTTRLGNSNHISGDWQHPSWANKILHWISRLHFLFTHTRKE